VGPKDERATNRCLFPFTDELLRSILLLLGIGGTIWQKLPLNSTKERADVSDPAPTVSLDTVISKLLLATPRCIVTGAPGCTEITLEHHGPRAMRQQLRSKIEYDSNLLVLTTKL